VSVNYEDKLDCFMHITVTAEGMPVDATQELVAIGLCNTENFLYKHFRGQELYLVVLSRTLVEAEQHLLVST
jgi:hypothetical protein